MKLKKDRTVILTNIGTDKIENVLVNAGVLKIIIFMIQQIYIVHSKPSAKSKFYF